MGHTTHEQHDHEHRPGCGHRAIQHEGHTDYLHDGHLHHSHAGHVDECTVAVGKSYPASCTPQHACGEHDEEHEHGASCGHETVPHGDHSDYLVGGHLHNPHGEHCDDHGAISLS